MSALDHEASRIIDEADVVFADLDRLRVELRSVESAINALCRSYDKATGCWGLRPEALRRVVNERRAHRVA